MKNYTKLFLFFICLIGASFGGFSQVESHGHNHGINSDAYIAEKLKNVQFFFDEDSLRGFNEAAARQQAGMAGAPAWEQKMQVSYMKRRYINTKYGINTYANRGGGNPTVQAPCTNVDFETGTTAGWTMTEGVNSNSTTQGGCCPSATTRFSVVGPGTDAAIPALATVPPGGGNYALLIGDGATVGGYVVRARQSFNVTAATSVFVYKYAVVLEDAGHSCVDQPYFNISFTDCSNNPIPCGDYNVVNTSSSCSGGDPSFVTSGIYKWKNWTTRSFDLTPYIGQCVNIEFTASDCVQTGHAGWAYVDASCQPMTLNLNGTDIPVGQTTSNMCVAQTNTLCAPPGFTSYTWNGPGVTGQATQCIQTSTGGTYSVTLGMAGSSCNSPVLYSAFTLVPKPTANFNFTTTPCQTTFTVPFQNTSSLNGGPAITNYYWDFQSDNTTDNSTPNPTNTYPGAGTYSVELKVSNGGCADSTTKVLTVTPAPTPDFTVSPVCLNSAANFTATSTPTAGIASHTWNFGDGPGTSSGPNPSHTYTTPGTYVVSYTVTNTSGCSNTFTRTVTINPNPVIGFTSNTVCLGVGTAFTNTSSVSAPDNIVTWSWDFDGNGTGDNSTQSPTNTYPSSGNFTAVLTGTTNNGCVGTASATVKVNALPTATFTPVNACLNNNVVLNNTSSIAAPDNISNYSWNFGAGASPATANGPTANPTPLVYSTSGIKTIVLNITANTTCSATITQTVEVYPQPVANFSATAVCQGTATAFTDLSTTAVGTITGWAWDYTNNGSTDNTTQNPSNSYSPSGTYTPQLIVTTSNGCKDTVAVAINVWGHAVPDFTATTVCFNMTTGFTNLTSTSTNPNTGGTPGYSWDFGDSSPLDVTANPSHTYTSSISGATFNAVLTVTTTNGCVDAITKAVKINALPTASFTPVNACLNNNVLLNNSSSIGLPDNIASYNWSFGAGAAPATSTVQNPPTLAYSSSGIKTITLTITANTTCTATITQTVDIYPQPVANFSTTSVCQSTATAFTDLSTTAVGTITGWAWDYTNNGSTDNATQNPSNTYSASGTYTTNLIVTTINGCKDTVALPVNVWGHAVPDFTATTVCFNYTTNFGNLTGTPNPNTGGTPGYSWNFGDGSPTDASTDPSHTYTSSINGATFNASLTVTTTNGCVDSVSKVVKINALPTATFTPVNACMNNNVLLNNTSTIGAPDNINIYSWDFGANASPLTSAAQNPPSLSYSTSGIKTITLTVTANTSCTATITQTVDIYPQPVANFSTTSVCQSTATAFTDLSTTTVGTITGWDWDFTNNSSIDNSTQNPTNVFAGSGTFTTALIATSSNGCKDTVKLAVDVWGHTLPDFSPDNVCFGTATTFTNLTSETINQNTGSPSTYSWNFADGSPVNIQTNPSHTYTLGGNANATYNVTLTATSFHGCADSIVKVVKVFAVPTASFTADSVCFGSPTHVTDASNGNGNVIGTYDWDFSSDGTVDASATANPNHLFPNIGLNPVSYTVSTNPVAGLTCRNVTTSLTVWVNPNPVPAFTFGNSCINAQPNTFDGSSSTIAIGTNTAYAWAYGDAATSSGTMSTTSHTYALAQAYNVTLTVTSDKGCMTSITHQVDVYPKPAANFTFSPTCDGKVMTLGGMSLPGSGTIVNWNWDMNNSISSFEKNTQVITYSFPTPSAGTQSVTLVTVTNHGCQDTVHQTVYIDYVPKPDFDAPNRQGCPEHCVTFTDLTPAVTGPAQNVDWKWVFGDGQELHSATGAQQPHCYNNTTSNQVNTYGIKLVVTTDKGCTDSISKASYITVYPTPIAAYDVAPNPGDVVTPLIYFTNHSVDYTKWWWSFGDGPQLDSTNVDPTHFYGSETAETYQSILIVENQYGCRDEARVKVEILPEFTFYIPNAFTPANNDNINDVFTGKGIGIEHYEMWIFDRWGAMIYYTDDIAKGWNGKVQGKSQEVQQDVYIWKVKLRDVLGKKHEYIGHVTVLR